jgi:hypothetical protein
MTVSVSVGSTLGHWLGLTRGCAAVLGELYAASGRPLTAAELARRTGTNESTVARNHLVKVRQALDGEAVDYVSPAGYFLTMEGLAECRGILHEVGEELLAA